MFRKAYVCALALGLSACGTLDPSRFGAPGDEHPYLLLDGGGPDINIVRAAREVDRQNAYLVVFAESAGLSGAAAAAHTLPISDIEDGKDIDPATSKGLTDYLAGLQSQDWQRVTDAGVTNSTGQCEDYLHAIWELNRVKTATNTEINLTGSLVSAILGAVKSSAPAIAITASAFGFASGTFDNGFSSLLYQLEPSGVDALVHNSQDAVKSTISASEKDTSKTWTRNDAVANIRLYLSVCTPQSIEASVNNAVKTASVSLNPPAQPSAASNQAASQSNTLPAPAAPNSAKAAGPLGATAPQINAAPANH